MGQAMQKYLHSSLAKNLPCFIEAVFVYFELGREHLQNFPNFPSLQTQWLQVPTTLLELTLKHQNLTNQKKHGNISVQKAV